MKKLAYSLLACLAFIQPGYAATSALAESLLEYQAITTAIGSPTQTFIPATEFIIDIKRITSGVNVTGEVLYKIVVRDISAQNDNLSSSNETSLEMSGSRHKHHHHISTYIANLTVTPNTGIGPNTVTVNSIALRSSQFNTLFQVNEDSLN